MLELTSIIAKQTRHTSVARVNTRIYRNTNTRLRLVRDTDSIGTSKMSMTIHQLSLNQQRAGDRHSISWILMLMLLYLPVNCVHIFTFSTTFYKKRNLESTTDVFFGYSSDMQ